MMNIVNLPVTLKFLDILFLFIPTQNDLIEILKKISLPFGCILKIYKELPIVPKCTIYKYCGTRSKQKYSKYEIIYDSYLS
jgi:hypothetical protein